MEGFTVEPEATQSEERSPQHFDLSAEDQEGEKQQHGRTSSFEQAFNQSPSMASGDSGEDSLQQVRERLRFLSVEDQKTVCRRECQLAQQQQEALQRQMQQTIERYRRVVQLHEAVDQTSGDRVDPEVQQKCQERIELLEAMWSKLCSEPPVSSQMSPMERAKGFAFSSYATTANAANKLKEGTGPVLENARSAFASLTSRFSRREPVPGASPPRLWV
ncbi:unnamed protein product [Durusdinium trenchii]|uniref:Uncharacterized protein n=1 Tax=Durusdinium trenchii TaxID=1381693 RepID=A0ABP0SZ34_9DINO